MDSAELLQSLAHRSLTVATGESLTAGAVAARIAEVPGASAVLLGGVVAYCNEVKADVLGVSENLLEQRGAVDPDVAAQMAAGAAERCGADIGISTTGVAGPEPHQGKDVGTVYLGLACRREAVDDLGLRIPQKCTPTDGGRRSPWLTASRLLDLDGERADIRSGTVDGALTLLTDFLNTEPPGLAHNS